MNQSPDIMQLPDHVTIWLKLLLSLTSHNDISVRRQAVTALKQHLPIILKNKQKVIAACATFLKEVSSICVAFTVVERKQYIVFMPTFLPMFFNYKNLKRFLICSLTVDNCIV